MNRPTRLAARHGWISGTAGPRMLAALALALAAVCAVPAHAATPRSLTPEVRAKFAQMVAQGKNLMAMGARPRFDIKHQAPRRAIAAAASAAVQSGRSASDGIISVPHFDFVATSGGQQYPLMFVGSDPARGGATFIRNTIIPISITLPLYDPNFNPLGEMTFDGASKVANTLASPIYSPASYAGPPGAGLTQWGDAMQRTTFFGSMNPARRDWHVLLAPPRIAETVNTADFFDGFAIDFGDGSPPLAFVAGEFIDGIIASYLASNPPRPGEVPIFVSYNALLFYGGDPFGGCCVLGYHDAIVTGTRGTDLIVQTFMFANWGEPGVFSVPIQDIHALSHEVSEWLNDPFINNLVPPYANGEGTGCDTLMETGDQLVGNTVPVLINGFNYHPQTQDILQYFTRETPSTALGGSYIFPADPGVTNAAAPPCP